MISCLLVYAYLFYYPALLLHYCVMSVLNYLLTYLLTYFLTYLSHIILCQGRGNGSIGKVWTTQLVPSPSTITTPI